MGSDPWTSYDRLLKHARERERERSQLRAAVNLATDYMRGWGSIQALAALEKIELILPQNASGVAAAGATPD